MRLIDAKTAYWKLVDAGQHSKRYKLNEMWELNCRELEEALDEVETVDAIPTDWLEKWLVEQVKNEDIKAVMVVAKLLVDWSRDVKR